MLKEIFKKSFKIIWRHPRLWVLGFFSTMVFLSANEFALIFLFPSFFIEAVGLEKIYSFKQIPSNLSWFLGGALVLIIFILLIIAVFSEIFLIFSVKKIREENLGEKLVKKSFKKTGEVLLLRLAEFLLIVLIGAIFAWLGIKVPLIVSVIFLIFFSLFILLVLFLVRYTIFYLLIENLVVTEALKKAFRFWQKNWLKTFQISLLIFVILFVYGFIVLSLLAGGVFGYPLRFVNIFLNYLGGTYGFWLAFIITTIFNILLQLFIFGLIAAYQLTCWTLFYLEKRGEIVNNFSIKKTSEI